MDGPFSAEVRVQPPFPNQVYEMEVQSEVSPSFPEINNNSEHKYIVRFQGLLVSTLIRLWGQSPAGKILSSVKVFTVLLNVPPWKAIHKIM